MVQRFPVIFQDCCLLGVRYGVKSLDFKVSSGCMLSPEIKDRGILNLRSPYSLNTIGTRCVNKNILYHGRETENIRLLKVLLIT